MLVTIFSRALGNLTLWGIVKILLLSMVCYMVSIFCVGWLIVTIINNLLDASGVTGWLLNVAKGSVGIMVSWFFFPLLYPIFISFFDDQIASVIEEKDYPEITHASPPFWPTILQDVGFTCKAILLNVLCLPLYFIPLLGQILYYCLNGYLLGMQFFRMSAGRRVPLVEAKKLMAKGRGTIFLTGVAISFCSTIPILNFAAPVLGVAAMLHLFHLLHYANTPTQQILPPQ